MDCRILAKKNKDTPVKLEIVMKVQSFLENLLFAFFSSFRSIIFLFRSFIYKLIRRKEIDAMKKRYRAIDNGGINSTAISTIIKEKPQKKIIRINNA